jgi:prolyl 4-hydroxylase
MSRGVGRRAATWLSLPGDQEAIARAQAGDAHAQYTLSAALYDAGQVDESLRWLRLAAQRKLIPAQLTLAAMLIDGKACPRDLPQAIELLRPLAATHVQANLLLADLHGFAALGAGDRATGLRYLVAAARLGDAGALQQLVLLGACHRRWDLVRPLFDAAARRGAAAATCGLARCPTDGLGGPPDPAIAPSAAPPIDWRVIEDALPQLAGDIPLPRAELLCECPEIRRLPGVIHPVVLDALISLAAPLVRRSQVVDAQSGEMRVDPMRTSAHVTLGPRHHDHVLEAIEHCIAQVSGLPVHNGEFLQIMRYRIGEEFKPHVDYFNETGAAVERSLADGGQRARTVLLYLNDNYVGGGTSFPKLKLQIKGVRGDMLYIDNLDADGRGHRDTLHAGLPVTRGEKWLLSKWIRSGRYPPRLTW